MVSVSHYVIVYFYMLCAYRWRIWLVNLFLLVSLTGKSSSQIMSSESFVTGALELEPPSHKRRAETGSNSGYGIILSSLSRKAWAMAASLTTGSPEDIPESLTWHALNALVMHLVRCFTQELMFAISHLQKGHAPFPSSMPSGVTLAQAAISKHLVHSKYLLG